MNLTKLRDGDLLDSLRVAQSDVVMFGSEEPERRREAWQRVVDATRELERRYPPDGVQASDGDAPGGDGGSAQATASPPEPAAPAATDRDGEQIDLRVERAERLAQTEKHLAELELERAAVEEERASSGSERSRGIHRWVGRVHRSAAQLHDSAAKMQQDHADEYRHRDP